MFFFHFFFVDISDWPNDDSNEMDRIDKSINQINRCETENNILHFCILILKIQSCISPITNDLFYLLD